MPSARAAARAIGGGLPADHLTRQVLASDLVLICTKDDAIAAVAAELGELGGTEWRGKVVLHTSGAIDSSILRPLADVGAATGSIHPMQTFARQNMPELSGRVFGIEGSSAALRAARKITRQLDGVAVRLSGSDKAAYHAAGLFACSHVLALVEAGTRLLMAQGFTRRQAMRALLSLSRQMLDNFERMGPRAAWTGPMPRGDYSTVERHARALAKFPPEYLEAYSAVSRLSAVVLSGDTQSALAGLEAALRAADGDGKSPRRAAKKRAGKPAVQGKIGATRNP